MTRRRMPFEKKMPLPFFAQVNSNMLVIEEAVRQQPGAKTTMDEEILAKVRMAREEMVAARKWTNGWGAVTCTKEEPEKKNKNE